MHRGYGSMWLVVKTPEFVGKTCISNTSEYWNMCWVQTHRGACWCNFRYIFNIIIFGGRRVDFFIHVRENALFAESHKPMLFTTEHRNHQMVQLRKWSILSHFVFDGNNTKQLKMLTRSHGYHSLTSPIFETSVSKCLGTKGTVAAGRRVLTHSCWIEDPNKIRCPSHRK